MVVSAIQWMHFDNDNNREEFVRSLLSVFFTKGILGLPDYAASWILHAFWKEKWKGKESLATLDTKLPTSKDATRRELLIALRKTNAARLITYDAHDPWQHRARVWATGDLQKRSVSGETDTRMEWLNTLYDALART
jgi:hypothetical protein